MVATNDRTVTVFGGTGFFGAASFGICALTDFLFGSLQGIRIGGTDRGLPFFCIVFCLGQLGDEERGIVEREQPPAASLYRERII